MKALVIGINSYPGAPLHGCINDAEEVAELLEKHDDGRPNFAVRKLIDPKTSREIWEEIENLFKGDGNVSLLYFSGHGYIDFIGGDIVTPDCYGSSYKMGISMSDIMQCANKSKVKNKIILLDCCHSGNMGKAPDGDGSTLAPGVSILTACKEDEPAMERGGHGVFTNLLCDALRGGAADFDGKISIGSIYAYIDKSLNIWLQRPIFKTNVSQFISLRSVTPKVPLSIIRRIKDYFPESTHVYGLDPSYEFTNRKDYKHEVTPPYTNFQNVEIFKDLQKLQSIGLVEPCEEEHMYFAAMHSKSCRLTSLGKHYWKLAKESKI